MMSRKKKTIIIASIVIAAFAIMGIVYALLSDSLELTNKITVGSVKIDTYNLKIKDAKGEDVQIMSPADIDTISWTTENKGTAGVLTRHTLEIYWDDNVQLYLYPANMSDSAILEDFEKIQNGQESTYLLNTQAITKEVNGVTKNGLKYNLVGDNLNGSDNNDTDKNISKEVNYNSTVSSIIDANINTDDNNKKLDTVAFKVLLSPKTSYLNQGKNISAKVLTEAMQYTEDGQGEWVVADVAELP